MKVNLTLALQLIHFILTWKVLKAFVLKPAYQALKIRKQKEHDYEEMLEAREKFIKTQHALQARELFEFQKNSKDEYRLPKTEEVIFDSSIPYTRDEEEIRKLKAKVTRLIIEEVPRVR